MNPLPQAHAGEPRDSSRLELVCGHSRPLLPLRCASVGQAPVYPLNGVCDRQIVNEPQAFPLIARTRLSLSVRRCRRLARELDTVQPLELRITSKTRSSARVGLTETPSPLSGASNHEAVPAQQTARIRELAQSRRCVRRLPRETNPPTTSSLLRASNRTSSLEIVDFLA